MRLVFVRHGQYIHNLDGIFDVEIPGPPLTDEGRRQVAELVAGWPAGTPPEAVYSSPLRRAEQTAAAVADRFGLPVAVRDGLAELDVGELQGRGGVEADTRFITVMEAWAHGQLEQALPGGGETGEQAERRLRGVLEEALAAHSAGPLLLVGHGGIFRFGLARLCGNLPDDYGLGNSLPNTGRIEVEARDGQLRCLSWNGVDLSAREGR
ncbi:MAG: histidine phosphatase family protein [Mycobacteriales bacterium]